MTNKKKTRSRPKELYRVRNWAAYDAALVNRGALTIWITQEAIEAWEGERKAHVRGRPKAYSDLAIETTLTLKEVFHLTNRGAEGFVRSVFAMMKIDLCVPDHTTLSRRSKVLKVHLPKRHRCGLHLVVDSTGLKVYGEGEWKMRTHGKSKRRTWRKLHLCVDRHSGEIETMLLTEAGLTDGEAAVMMLQEIDRRLKNTLRTELMINVKRIKGLGSIVPTAKSTFRLEKMLIFGSMEIVKHPHILEMKTCAISVSMDALPGNETLSIINVLWQKPPCFA